MYKRKYKDLNYITNVSYKNNLKKLLIFPGLGCEALEYSFLFKLKNLKYQIIIFELPGHNNLICNLRDDYLLSFSKKINSFLNFKKIKKFSVYTHSMSGIIPILLVRFFSRSLVIKNFLNNEGNLIESDSSIVTRKTVSYDLDFYKETGFFNFISLCNESSDKSIKNWSLSLRKLKAEDFYFYCKSSFMWSKKNILLSSYKNVFKKKNYIFGANSKNLDLLKSIYGMKKTCLLKSGHFSYLYNNKIFTNILIKSLIGN